MSRLPSGRKGFLLSSLALQLTVCARGAYADQSQGPEVIKKLRAFNELQQTVTNQLTHLLADDGRWYADADFVSILFEKARSGACEGDLVWAFEFVFGQLVPPAVER